MSVPSLPLKEWSQKNALAVLDGVADAIVTISSNGLIQYVNAATSVLFGYTAPELLGAPVKLLMPESHATTHDLSVQQYLKTGEARIIGEPRELIAQRKDGAEFPVQLTVTELKTGEGVYFAGVIRDLTAQKALQVSMHAQREQLARVGRLSTMGEMAASIAHEMNQPLTAIAMYAQTCQRLLAQSEIDIDKLTGALNRLADQALRAGAVNERVQQFVRHDDRPLELNSINKLLGDIEPLASGDARLHGVKLGFKYSQALPDVRCSGLQIQQVALNLIRNALDAMTEAGCKSGQTVEVLTDQHNGMIRVSVVDSGPGISDTVEKELFSPFHTTKKQGMGLGLSTCRTLISDHGGRLDFFNNEPAPGATFFFDLPIGEDDE